jgi:oligopeptidase B
MNQTSGASIFRYGGSGTLNHCPRGIRTNAEAAEDFKIVWTPLATPGRAHWRDLVPYRPGVHILSFIVVADWLIRLEREDGLPRIIVRHLASGEEHVIAFGEEAYSLGSWTKIT